MSPFKRKPDWIDEIGDPTGSDPLLPPMLPLLSTAAQAAMQEALMRRFSAYGDPLPRHQKFVLPMSRTGTFSLTDKGDELVIMLADAKTRDSASVFITREEEDMLFKFLVERQVKRVEEREKAERERVRKEKAERIQKEIDEAWESTPEEPEEKDEESIRV